MTEQASEDALRWAQRVADRFADERGHRPDGVHVAPGRVNLIGEHLDYNGGRCLPFALTAGCYVASARREDTRLSVHSLQVHESWTGDLADLGPGRQTGWASYVAGVVWALREDNLPVPGMDLLVDGRVPLGAGLSSSAAVECAVALAACAAAGVEVDADVRRQVVTACIRAENDVAGAATGGLDQNIAIFAEPGHAMLLDFADGTARQVPWDPAAHGLEVVVMNTRVSHVLTDGGYAARRADCEAAARALGTDLLAAVADPAKALSSLDDARLRRRARHVFTEQQRVSDAVAALEAGDMLALGGLLTASHASLRDDFEVSCPELDTACAAAVEAGAHGARMTGGGFGGSAIALAPKERAEAIRAAVSAAYAERGWREPEFLPGAPGPGARQLL